MGFIFAVIIVLSIYVGVLSYLIAVAVRVTQPHVPDPDHKPTISILVAARNEETHLPACLDALRAQQYPPSRYEIVVANDQSTDATGHIIQSYMDQDARIKGVSVVHSDEAGKPNAIHQAAEAASGDILVITDADCSPPSDWLPNLVSYFADPTLGMVCGITTIIAHRLNEQVQQIDWMYLTTLGSLFSLLGHPVTALGNNMALRRKTYEDIGGYPALPFSVTEDFILFQAVINQTNLKAIIPFDPKIENRTQPQQNLREAFLQRKRWARGGLRAKPWVHVLYTTLYFCHVLLLGGLFIAPLFMIPLLIIKCVVDWRFVKFGLRHFDKPFILKAFLCFELYMFAYVTLMPFALLFTPRIRWKGRVH